MLDLLLPPQCPGCGREGVALCPACGSVLARRLDEPPGLPLGLPAWQPAGLAQLEWCAAYSGPARACLHALKYGGELRLVEPLAELMAQRWRASAIGGEVLISVPVHAGRRRQRGFDQAELLAREVGRRLGLPVLAGLERSASTRAQHQLGRGARAGNVGGMFTVAAREAASVRGRWLVLVDDVITTGATLSACGAALHSAGAAAVSGLTFARER
ncbi:MAG TPA: phosphoribosyltransferase family protein [Candidatus Limnocylindria bacterium]|nr:phosphoribosyltransferase family protein [Candidatus Limnocylindria bacterium]